MAMDFPNSPTVNQTFTVGDKTWKWTGTAWEIVVNRPAMRSVADTPPANPIVGDEWFNSLTGRTYTWFDSYWVEVNTNSVVGASGLNGVASASAPLVYTSGSNNISVQSAPTFTDGITTNAGADGQVLKLKARSSDNFNQIAWYNSGGTNFTGLWQVLSDSSVNIVRNTTPGGTSQNFQNSISINAAGNVTMPAQPAGRGRVNAITTSSTNVVPGLTTASGFLNGGVVLSGGSNERIVVPTAGKYQVNFAQLISTPAAAVYVWVVVNGGGVYHAYSNNDDTYDTGISIVLDLAANDFINFQYGGTVGYAWGDVHSMWSIAKVS